MTGSVFPGVLVSIIIVAGGGLMVVAFKSARRVDARLAGIGLSVLVVHVLVGLLLLAFFGIDNSDAKEYHRNAGLLAQSWAGDPSAVPRLLQGKSGWIYVLASGYYLGSPTPVIGVAINAVFLAATCVLVGKAARDFGLNERAQVCSATIAALPPAYWIWGSQPLREASVSAALAASLFFTGRVLAGRPIVGLAGLGTSLVALYTVRGSLVFIAVAAAGLALLASSLTRRVTVGKRLLLIVAALATLPFAQSALATTESERSFDRISAVRDAQSTQARSGFETGGDIASNSGLVSAITDGLPRVAVGPLPWEMGTVSPLLLNEAIYFWAVTALFVLGYMRVPSVSLRWFTVVALGGLYLALAVYSGNYGTMLRIRAMAYPYLALVAALGWVRIRPARDRVAKELGERRRSVA